MIDAIGAGKPTTQYINRTTSTIHRAHSAGSTERLLNKDLTHEISAIRNPKGVGAKNTDDSHTLVEKEEEYEYEDCALAASGENIERAQSPSWMELKPPPFITRDPG